jgi:Glycosyltransferase family 87
MDVKTSTAAVLLFLLCLVSFLIRGPYRYLHGEPGDYATNYSAGRCWAKGENPYDHPVLDREFHASGGPPEIVVNQHERGSIYLISAMPFFALVSWMPWKTAMIVWLLLSLACIGSGLLSILIKLPATANAKWLIGGAALALCTPTLFGLLAGNPSIPVVGLTIVAVYLAIAQRPFWSALCLGLAFSVKPQVAIAAVLALALWKYWTPVLISVAALAGSTLVGYARAGSVHNVLHWITSLRTNIQLGNAPGGVTDFSLASGVSWQMVNAQAVTSIFLPDRVSANVAAWVLCALLTLLYITLRARAKRLSLTRDFGFLACLSMLPVYHRVHDADILLVLIAVAVELWRNNQKALATSIAVCMAVLFAPVEKFILTVLGTSISDGSLLRALLIHCSAVLVLILTALTAAAVWERSDGPLTTTR